MVLKVVGSSSKGNAYALVSNDGILLLECGLPLREVKRAIDYRISDVVGCLASHRHFDHVRCIKEYLEAGIPVYTNKEVAAIMDGVKNVHGMPEKATFKVGEFFATPFYVPHNDTPCFAYIVGHKEMGRMLFATDFEFLPYTLKTWGISHFLIECNYDMETADTGAPNYEHKLKGHASVRVTKDIIALNKTKNLRNVILCHIGHDTDAGERFAAEIREVTGEHIPVMVARPGLSVELMDVPF